MARPAKIHPLAVTCARWLLAAGHHHQEIADALKISKRSVYNVEERFENEPAVEPPGDDGSAADDTDGADGGLFPDIDPTLPILEQARLGLAQITAAIAALPKDSPRLNPARAQWRQTLKLVQALEREHAREESPEEAAKRARREDRETQKRVMVYVEQWEKEARRPTPEAPFGRCVHCEAALPEDKAVELYGEPG